MRLTGTHDGDVWLGGALLGQLRRVGNVLTFESHPFETQPSTNVLAIKYEPHTHKLWTRYNGGLAVRDENGQWKEITTRDGLLVNGCWSLAPLPTGMSGTHILVSMRSPDSGQARTALSPYGSTAWATE